MRTVREVTSTAHKVRAHLRARWVLRRAAEVGRLVRLDGRARVVTAGTLRIGERVRMIGHVVPVELAVERGGELTIGDRTFLNYGVSIGATHSIRIGSDCSFGPYVNVVDTGFHGLEPERRGERPPPEPVRIGDNVWLGVRVIVLPGVAIGDGAVIGAGSVVTGDIPPRALAVGVPARVLRML
jgi:maltose O-acetyltransferase